MSLFFWQSILICLFILLPGLYTFLMGYHFSVAAHLDTFHRSASESTGESIYPCTVAPEHKQIVHLWCHSVQRLHSAISLCSLHLRGRDE